MWTRAARSVVCLFTLTAALMIGLTGVGHATSGSCTDPPNDVQDQSGNPAGTGPLDIVKVSHSDTPTTVTYNLQTLTAFDTSDVDFIIWGIDTNGDSQFEGYMVVEGNPLTASLLDNNNQVVETGSVSHTDGTTTLSATIDSSGLKTLGVVKTYRYFVVAQQSYYEDDGAGPCTHTLTTALESAPTIKLDESSVEAGGIISGTVTGYKPGTNVTIYVHSTRVLLGTAAVASSGSATFRFGLPSSIGAGTHTIEVDGVDPAGTSLVQSASFQVVAAPASSTAPSLQKTGAPVARDVAMAMTILLLGLSWMWLAFIGRRRSVADEIVPAPVYFEPADSPRPAPLPAAELTRPIPAIPLYGRIPLLPRETD